MKSLIRIIALTAAVQFAGPSPVAASDDADRTAFVAGYDFYIGGLSIAEILFDAALTPSGYEATSVVETRGLLEMLVSGRVSALATGYRHPQGHLTPDSYRTDYTTRSEARSVSMNYADEVADVTITPPEPLKVYDTSPASHPGALDPVTAAVTVMNPRDSEEICNRTIPIFDGKRRYDIILLPLDRRPEGSNAPEPSWPTPLVRCFGVYERIAGFDANLQRDQRYFPFDIWFESTGGPIYRAVRLAGKTKLGYAIGTLRK